MKKGTITLLVVIGIIAMLFFWIKGSYNSLVSSEINAEKTWANVETQYQRRADLIPNFVNTVKGYATHEKETLTAITEQRANATRPEINFEDLNEKTLAQYQQEQTKIGTSLSRLMMISENYPDLKANQNFVALQDELSGTENRIAVARKDFNNAVSSFNLSCRQFPNNIFASMFGFEKKAMFKAEQGSEKAPTVQF